MLIEMSTLKYFLSLLWDKKKGLRTEAVCSKRDKSKRFNKSAPRVCCVDVFSASLHISAEQSHVCKL